MSDERLRDAAFEVEVGGPSGSPPPSSRDDLEALRALASDLQRSNTMKANVLAAAAHEMRNPIMSILGYARLLRDPDSGLDADDRRDALDALDRQARRLDRLVGDLLSASVLDGEVELERSTVDLVALVDQVIGDSATDAEVDVRIPPGTTVWADADRLAQIVGNLLANAARYGDGEIVVEAAAESGGVELRVCDNGPGVPPEFVPHLFERFSRASDAVSSGVRGTGLGLAIVRGLARAHGGDAWYEPKAPHGCCFAVRLPAAPDPTGGTDLPVP
jgi:signal transduction histidine kinase